jgi:hypothetical protein
MVVSKRRIHHRRLRSDKLAILVLWGDRLSRATTELRSSNRALRDGVELAMRRVLVAPLLDLLRLRRIGPLDWAAIHPNCRRR